MNTAKKQKIKEWVGICSGMATLGFCVVGIFSLQSIISLWGSLAILLALIISYKYV